MKGKKLKRRTFKLLIPVFLLALLFGMCTAVYAEDTAADTTSDTVSEEYDTSESEDFDMSALEDYDTSSAESFDSEDMSDEELAALMESLTSSTMTGALTSEESVSSANASSKKYWTYATVAVAVIGALAVLAVAGVIVMYIRRRKKENPKPAGKGFNISMSVLTAAFLVLIVAVNLLTTTYASAIDAVLARYEGVEVETSSEDWIQLAYDIASEGMVLLENNDDTLPLDTATETKVNLLGYYAYNPNYSGTGSGGTDETENTVSIVDGLTNAGFEVNTAVLDEGVYEVDESSSSDLGFEEATYTVEEVSIDSYTGEASFESMKEYSDIAIVVLCRAAGEGADLTDYESDEGNMYLELTQNEKDLLEAATDTFEKVIVVYNGGNALEMDFMEDYDIDALIWCGDPGEYGFDVLGQIISGEVNPSGSLPDTWVYDSYSAAASENFANQEADNTDGYYVDYVEGIYVGYRWYETAYAESAVITNTTNGVTYDFSDYYSIVRYPFGYGLSYTTFEQEIVGGISDGDVLDPTGTISVEVEVTNTGDVAGKETVQLYVTVPYTEYDQENGVEKSEVTLVGYAKTSELEPGESETVTVEVSVEDYIASYDSSYNNGDGTYGSYMLDAGEYVFSIRSDSHTVIDSVSMTLDESWFYSGENQRSSDEQAAYNQFDDAARGEYLSRQDGFANYESAMNSVSSSVESTEFDDDPAAYDDWYDEAVTEELVEGVDYDADGDLTLDDMEGLDYDDPLWDELIAQLSVEELVDLAEGALGGTVGVESIGTDDMGNTEGPSGITSMYSSIHTVSYPTTVTLAATFNNDLAYQYGQMIADQAHDLGMTSWNAPAVNIHRWAYSGRNYEYFSEDAVLSAGIAAYEVKGATDNGLLTYVKHFALNNMESNRSGQLHTYSNEQAIREIYLKSFEAAVKIGNTHGIMSSMNYIGDVYTSVSYELLTEVLRNEWGFDGVVVTDMAEGDYATLSSDSAIRAGTNTWLAVIAPSFSTDSDADIYYLQEAAHGLLYAFANVTRISSGVYDWQTYIYLLSVELAVLAASCIGAIVVRSRKPKKKKVQTQAEA